MAAGTPPPSSVARVNASLPSCPDARAMLHQQSLSMYLSALPRPPFPPQEFNELISGGSDEGGGALDVGDMKKWVARLYRPACVPPMC